MIDSRIIVGICSGIAGLAAGFLVGWEVRKRCHILDESDFERNGIVDVYYEDDIPYNEMFTELVEDEGGYGPMIEDAEGRVISEEIGLPKRPSWRTTGNSLVEDPDDIRRSKAWPSSIMDRAFDEYVERTESEDTNETSYLTDKEIEASEEVYEIHESANNIIEAVENTAQQLNSDEYDLALEYVKDAARRGELTPDENGDSFLDSIVPYLIDSHEFTDEMLGYDKSTWNYCYGFGTMFGIDNDLITNFEDILTKPIVDFIDTLAEKSTVYVRVPKWGLDVEIEILDSAESAMMIAEYTN